MKMLKKRMLAGVIVPALVVSSLFSGNNMKTVSAKSGKNSPKATVSLKEVKQVQQKMTQDENGQYVFSARIKNNGEDKIKKIVYTYLINEKKNSVSVVTPSAVTTGESAKISNQLLDEVVSRKVSLVAKNIQPGKMSKLISCQGDMSGDINNMQLQKVELYSGTALFIRNYVTGKTSLDWAKPDKKAPVISGWVKKDSFNGSDVFWNCYSDKKSTYNFKKYVSARDNRDGEVKVKVDTSEINWNKEGVYKVYYTAKDSSGNIGKSWARVRVYIPGTAEKIADSVLGSITSKNASDEAKARAIYSYVKGHCAYVDRNTHSDWRSTAVNGLRYRAGDCYTFYSMARLLLTRAGIPNVEVTRYPAAANHHHWWNLVYVRGGWYHLDTTPRRLDGRFCLMTDAQLAGWTRETTNPFHFQHDKYPARATKIISSHP